MIKIGILGDIGSGKSYVAKKFGFPVFDADVEIIKIYKKDINRIELMPLQQGFNFFSINFFIFKSSCKSFAYSDLEYHLEDHVLLIPNLMPFGLTFCPMILQFSKFV